MKFGYSFAKLGRPENNQDLAWVFLCLVGGCDYEFSAHLDTFTHKVYNINTMFFLKKIIIEYRQQKEARNARCDQYIRRITKAVEEVEHLFDNPKTYIKIDEVDIWKESNTRPIKDVNSLNLRELKCTSHYKTLENKIALLNSFSEQFKYRILKHNEAVLEVRITEVEELAGEVEGRKLDRQQLKYIAEDSENHLVIAGAGTGKTTTILGKIKYLIKSGECQPEEILALSFTNASASEMSERIAMEVGAELDVMTFHKLGLSIITKAEGVVPKITKLNLHKFIKEQLQDRISDVEYLRLLNRYLIYGSSNFKSEFDFKSQDEYEEYIRLNPPTTLNGEKVKSYGEIDIANFLFENGIKYIYEHTYKIDTRDEEYGQYYPDFYLPEYDIYIEYFGVDRKMEVPEYFSSSHGLSAKEAYLKSMDWKRRLHKENNTKLVECFAYEKSEDTLLQNLKNKLEKYNIKLSPMSPQELWDRVSQSNKNNFDNIISLFETIINLAKSNQYSIDYLERKSSRNTEKTLLSLVKPIFEEYSKYLAEHDEIDFNDMINRAASYIENGKYMHGYKYVIVDEYQDISSSRYNLLKTLREAKAYKLFCVGDDWQSIYRFAGSDIDYILNFEHYWGSSVISKIETTYRFPPQLVEISGDFVMRNPNQIKKNIVSRIAADISAFGEINGYTDKYAIQFMFNKIQHLPKDSSVFLIGRYAFDVSLLDNQEFLNYYYDNQSGLTTVKYFRRPDLDISFLTAHKSKGLQADYVFIINNKNTKTGFPSKIQDSPILHLLLKNQEDFPYAEERRLFYVALTRAKKKAFIVTVKDLESEFAKELLEEYQQEIKNERFECPECGGRLVKRSGPYGEFLGCSNYAKTGCRFKLPISHKNHNS